MTEDELILMRTLASDISAIAKDLIELGSRGPKLAGDIILLYATTLLNIIDRTSSDLESFKVTEPLDGFDLLPKSTTGIEL